MSYAAKVICDSVSPFGHRLTTFEVTMPRIVLAEFNTHRDKSRNSASSRAIPVPTRIAMIQSDPFVPDAFGKNQKGMQAAEALAGADDARAREIWLAAAEDAIRHAQALAKIGVHKQLANRLLEPFAWHTVIVTGTEWENHFALRANPKAQPEIQTPTFLMRAAMLASTPQPLGPDEWHLPYIFPEDRAELDRTGLVQVSAARCARVSYLTHDGKRELAADTGLYARLFSDGHVSPLEHPARPMTKLELDEAEMHEFVVRRTDLPDRVIRRRDAQHFRRFVASVGVDTIVAERVTYFLGNFNGWVQHRKELPGEAIFGTAPM
jgi:thymidylate synthase ThyX